MIRTARLGTTLSSLLLAVTLTLSALMSASTAHAQSSALRIAAVVNDDIVSVMDLTMRLRLALHSSRMPNTPENQQRLAPQVLRSLVDERLQEQEAKKLNISLSDEDLNAALRNIEQSNGMRPGDLQRLAASIGLPFNVIEDQIRISALWAKTVGRKYVSQLRITDEDVNDRLRQMEENLGRPEHLVSEIYLPFDAADNPEQLKNLSHELVQQLRQGAPFVAAARQFSRSPTALDGGMLGWVPQGQLEAELDRALADMKEGDVSDPIRTSSGYYILKLQARRTVSAPDPKQARLSISQIKLPLSGDKSLSSGDQAKVVDYISKSLRGCQTFDTYGKTLGTPGTGPLGSLKVSELPQSIASAVNGLKVGEPSQLLSLGGVDTILMVCERILPNVLPTKDQIRGQIQSERLARNADRLLRDLRRSAVIDVRI